MTTRPRLRHLAWAIPVGLVLSAVIVLAARWLRDLPALQDFVSTYPGTSALPAGTAPGIPGWVGVLHFLNTLFLLLIVRSGWEQRSGRRPAAYWTPRDLGPLRAPRPAPRLSLTLWLHLSLDTLWVATGIVYLVLLFASGHWVRIVPTSLDVVPNALSAVLQYTSLHWPVEDGWVSYNALQLLTYFVTVFVAAPLAIATGVRMSPAWPASPRLARIFPIGFARRLHFPVMLWFVGFTFVHVTLVLTTGILANLNHLYAASSDTTGWVGFGLFAGSVVILVTAWALARSTFLRPVASLTGTLSR